MRFRFGDFEADASRSTLERDGRPVAIEPKPLRLLLHLLTRHPAVVSKDELLQALWPEEAVTGDSLTRAVRAARRALGESGGAPVLIRNVRGHGYGIGVEVERVGEARGAASPAMRDPFVGREDVLAALGGALDAARAEHGRVELLVGEPGIGKTRVVEELARRARADGTEVAWGRAPESPGAPALWPWLEVLRSLASSRPAAALRAALGPGAPDVAAVVPAVRERLPKLAPPPHLPPEQARFRFFDAVAQLLLRVGAERPLLIVLDDLHWADPTTLQLLVFVARELVESRVLVVGTYRHVAAPPNDALDAALAELARLPVASPPRLLGGLSLAEVEQLVSRIEGRAVDATRMSAIYARSDGNPFFVRELVRLAEPQEPMATPGIAAIVRTRLRSLDEAARGVLEAASVLGREVPVRLLERMLEAEPGVVWDRLEEAERAGFVAEEREVEAPSFRFVHAVLYETLYAQLARRRGMDLHRRAGEALESLHASDLDPHVAALAHHFGKAAALGETRRAVDYTERAAHQARARFGFEAAARGYARALELLGPEGEAEGRCDLLLDLGETQALAGGREEARPAFRQAAGLARELRDGERLGRAALGFAGASEDILFADPESLALLEETLALTAGQASPVRVRVLGRLATLKLAVGQAGDREALTLTEEMVREARRIGEPATLAAALLDRSTVLQLRPLETPAEERMAAAAAALDAAQEAGLDDLVLQARRQCIAFALELGDAERLDADIHAFALASDRVRIRSQRHHAASYLAMRALQTGRFAEARVWIDAAEKLADPADPREAFFTPLTQRLLLPRTPESDRVLEAGLRRCIETLPLPHWPLALARLYFDAGRDREAGELVDRVLQQGFPATLEPNIGWMVGVVSIAHVVAGLGRRAQAAPLLELLRPFAAYHVTFGLGVGCLGPVAYYAGDLAVTAGRHEEASRHLDAALAMTDRTGARPWEAYTRLARARLLLAQDRADAARVEVDAVLQATGELGMPGLASRARGLISSSPCAR